MASRSVNKVILLGRLGKDAETTYTPSGVARTRFSVATSRRWKDQQSGDWKEETDWSNIVLWRGEAVATYLTKGKQVYIEGRLQSRSYDDKDGKKVYATEVVADDVILLGGRDDSAGGGGRPHARRRLQRPPGSGVHAPQRRSPAPKAASRRTRLRPGHHRRRRSLLARVKVAILDRPASTHIHHDGAMVT
jgi:single-strand DNA-binding protein